MQIKSIRLLARLRSFGRSFRGLVLVLRRSCARRVRWLSHSTALRSNKSKVFTAAASFSICIATIIHAQDLQFLFDHNGNLTAQFGGPALPLLPQIIGQPEDQTPKTGGTASYSVVVADPRFLTYQWRFDGTNIDGANGVSYSIEIVGATNEGVYDVVLTNQRTGAADAR